MSAYSIHVRIYTYTVYMYMCVYAWRVCVCVLAADTLIQLVYCTTICATVHHSESPNSGVNPTHWLSLDASAEG